MIKHFGESWTYDEIARAIGLRALGEENIDIALRLGRTREDVAMTLHKARCLLRSEQWIEPLLVNKRTPRADLPDPRADRLEPRTYRPKRNVQRLAAEYAATRDRTAALMGDPVPGRSALSKKGMTE